MRSIVYFIFYIVWYLKYLECFVVDRNDIVGVFDELLVLLFLLFCLLFGCYKFGFIWEDS